MSSEFLHWLETGAHFPLRKEGLGDISLKTKSLLEQSRLLIPTKLQNFNCDSCHEHCSLPVEYCDERPYFQCPTGYLTETQWLKDADIAGINFVWDELFHIIRKNTGAEEVEVTTEYPMIGFVAPHNAFLIFAPKIPLNFLESALVTKARFEAKFLGVVTIRRVLSKTLLKSLKAENVSIHSIEEMMEQGCFAPQVCFEFTDSAQKIRSVPILKVDFNQNTVHYKGHPVKLTPKPFNILAILIEKPGSRVSFEDIAINLWGENIYKGGSVEHNIETHLNTLRNGFKKLISKKSISKYQIDNLIKTVNKGLLINLNSEEIEIEGVFPSKIRGNDYIELYSKK